MFDWFVDGSIKWSIHRSLMNFSLFWFSWDPRGTTCGVVMNLSWRWEKIGHLIDKKYIYWILNVFSEKTRQVDSFEHLVPFHIFQRFWPVFETPYILEKFTLLKYLKIINFAKIELKIENIEKILLFQKRLFDVLLRWKSEFDSVGAYSMSQVDLTQRKRLLLISRKNGRLKMDGKCLE